MDERSKWRARISPTLTRGDLSQEWDERQLNEESNPEAKESKLFPVRKMKGWEGY